MRFILIGLACLQVVSSRSVVDPPIQPPGEETNGLCSQKVCAPGQTCKLLPRQDCTENCELFATCITTGTQVLNGTSSSNISVISPPALTCANMLCASGFVCSQVMVNCIRAPCPQPPPHCVPANNGSTGNQNQSCPMNELWNSCGNACEKTCATRNNMACPMICRIPGACVCQQGYVRQNGVCIPSSQCPTATDPNNCPANETYTACGSSCQPSCGNPRPGICTLGCITGCQCQDGFLKNSSGFCVSPHDCPDAVQGPSCSTVKCAAETECRMTAPLFCKTEPCSPQPRCVPKPDESTTLAPPKCVLPCPQGQRCELEQVQCFAPPCNPIPHCVPEDTPVDPVTCALIDCASGYRCVEEVPPCFVASCPAVANCVPMNTTDDQPPLPGSSCAATSCLAGSDCIEEEVECFAPPCPKQARCVAENSTGVTCANVRLRCQVGEQCGMVNGSPTCVPVSGNDCGQNETYRDCSSCENQCGQPLMMCPAVCGPPKCQCSNGYSRNSTGSCVLTSDCSKNGDIVPYPDYPLSCAVTLCPTGSVCVEENTQCIKAPCPSNAKCVGANNTNNTETTCDNTRLKCKADEQCGMPEGRPTCVPTCAKNETYTTCSTCEQSCSVDLTACAEVCGPAKCQCSFGYSRNSNGLCVLPDDCSQRGSNDTYNCGAIRCKKGFSCSLLSGVAKCIEDSAEKEDTTEECGKNEIFDGCGGCEATCENQSPMCAMACMPGKCACVAGFVRLNGKCVTFDKCDKIVDTDPVCGPNEDFTDCMPSCEANCRGDKCPGKANSTMSAAVCAPGCVCKPYYKRDHAGVCRHNRHCFSHAGCSTNEEWSRCKKCETICGTPNTTCDECKDDPGCRCKEGFARDNSGDCVAQGTGCH